MQNTVITQMCQNYLKHQITNTHLFLLLLGWKDSLCAWYLFWLVSLIRTHFRCCLHETTLLVIRLIACKCFCLSLWCEYISIVRPDLMYCFYLVHPSYIPWRNVTFPEHILLIPTFRRCENKCQRPTLYFMLTLFSDSAQFPNIWVS